MEQLFLAFVECTCPSKCDCECPEPKNGVAHVSMLCPEHNMYPEVDDHCMLVEVSGFVHRNQL